MMVVGEKEGGSPSVSSLLLSPWLPSPLSLSLPFASFSFSASTGWSGCCGECTASVGNVRAEAGDGVVWKVCFFL